MTDSYQWICLTISEILNHSQDQFALLYFPPLISYHHYPSPLPMTQSLENMVSYPKKLHHFSTRIASNNATDLIAHTCRCTVSFGYPWSQDILKEQVKKIDMPQEQEKRREDKYEGRVPPLWIFIKVCTSRF